MVRHIESDRYGPRGQRFRPSGESRRWYEEQRAQNFREWDRRDPRDQYEERFGFGWSPQDGGPYRDHGEGRFGDENGGRGYASRGAGRRQRSRGRSGLPVFDKTLQTTNIWLKEIMMELGPDRQHAWKVLSVVLHKLRDRLPVEVAAHLGAQLPLLIRGVYYDQFQPARQPVTCHLDEFLDEVDEWLADARPTDPRDAVMAVFRVLSRHIPIGEIEKVQDTLPRDIRAYWLDAEEDVVPPPNMRSARSNMPRRLHA